MKKRFVSLVSALWILFVAGWAQAEVEQPKPLPNTYVHDFAGVIADDKQSEIQAKAQRLKDEYKTEIAVVTIDSLQGEDSFDYSMRMARSWGIGSKDNDVRGLLILVAVKDRKTAFRTSRHIEGDIPDGATGEISRQMNAYFKQGDFGGGLSLGMDKLLERLHAVYQPQPAETKATNTGFSLGWLWLPVVGIPLLGLGYAVVRQRRKNKKEGITRRGTAGGFRTWASQVDPSTKPNGAKVDPSPNQKAKRKAASEKKPASRRAQPEKKKATPGTRPSPGYNSDSSSYSSSSSSYDSDSSSSSDSGSSYSGGSDYGGGGSDSSW